MGRALAVDQPPVGDRAGVLLGPVARLPIRRRRGGRGRRKGVDVVLGPTINLHRSPLGGRHFEAFSEDPELTGSLAAAYVSGLQDNGVAATPKHYVANDSETDRFTVDVRASERALRELYLAPFERTVTEAGTWAIMSAYNSVDGVTMSENDLLETPLNSEWGFDGVVVSDWTGVRSLGSAPASQDLAMPVPLPHGARHSSRPSATDASPNPTSTARSPDSSPSRSASAHSVTRRWHRPRSTGSPSPARPRPRASCSSTTTAPCPRRGHAHPRRRHRAQCPRLPHPGRWQCDGPPEHTVSRSRGSDSRSRGDDRLRRRRDRAGGRRRTAARAPHQPSHG
ncbi:hypothetical protein BWO91_01125 [Plantibacter flavus]|nr:hypothetical protein BWO91_01125 [Plantibacter flavus]